MKKIAIAGAGVGGMVCAYYLAQNGYDVTVYEKRKATELAYEWHDDIAIESFETVGLGMPPENIRYPKRNWTFVPPMSDLHVYGGLTEPTDVSVSRREFAEWVMRFAVEAGARFVFEQPVALWIEGDAVKGLIVDGKREEYALVVDNCGVDSALRAALPDSAGIQKRTLPDEVFCAYRAFYNRVDGVDVDDHETNRAYLLHEGGKGISWCIADPRSDEVDVLIGRQGALDETTLAELLTKLREDNPVLGDELLSGGKVCRIPIRHPLWVMVTDGYAALGDSAFMTIPLLGSGLAASMAAGRFLAETVVERQSVGKEALWHYQVRYYLHCGAEHCGVDVMKRWLLTANPADVRWLFESGVLSNKNINDGAAGKNIRLGHGELLQKAAKGYRRMGLLLKLSGLLSDCNKAEKIAGQIPRAYDETRIKEWRTKLDKIFE